LLHHFKLNIFKFTLPTSKGRDLMLKVFKFFRSSDSSRVQKFLIAIRPCSNLLDVSLGFGLRALQISDLRLGGNNSISQSGELCVKICDHSQSRKGASLVSDLIETGIHRLQIQQSRLDGRFDLHVDTFHRVIKANV